jgi:pimeloyl-ACP methyl ester carboxylesterase
MRSTTAISTSSSWPISLASPACASFPYSPKLRGRLARAKVPALILWGAQDLLVPAAHACAYAASLPDARVVVLPGAGHYPWLETPDRFAEEVERFVGEG